MMNDIIYGIHAVQALLEHNPQNVLAVYMQKEGCNRRRLKPLIKQLKQIGITIQQVTSRQWLNEKSKGAVHQGIIAKVRIETQMQENDLLYLLSQYTVPLFLVLDGVTDPHNLGACLRSADAAGVHAVIVPSNRSAQMNATVRKVASGAIETVPLIRVTNLARTLRFLQDKNVWIVGTDGEVEHQIFKSSLTGPLAIVIGSEEKGIRPLIRGYCNELISIPMAGSVSSLNVSVAAGVCLFEAVRQRISSVINS